MITQQEKTILDFCEHHGIEGPFPEGLVLITSEDLAVLLGSIRLHTDFGTIYREVDLLEKLREYGFPKPKWGELIKRGIRGREVKKIA